MPGIGWAEQQDTKTERGVTAYPWAPWGPSKAIRGKEIVGVEMEQTNKLEATFKYHGEREKLCYRLHPICNLG